MKKLLNSAIFFLVAISPTSVLAYVGPGAGVTMLGALWGVLIAIVMAIAGLLYWPIRALLRKVKKSTTGPTIEVSDASSNKR
jgi:hypothetical protein